MSLKIEIKSADVTTRPYQKDGKSYTFREQFGYVHLANEPYPTKMKISLTEAQQPYQPGSYTLDESCFYVGKYDQLSIGRLRLVPVAQSRAA
ncbi:single-stranded DNA-binding protein [Sedimenticola sp.]|uniref:single-stranded DNA-binding protein n=1 Tax=Sedimenticola sp. TaxID=1940285 RepID=UPI003D0CFEE0